MKKHGLNILLVPLLCLSLLLCVSQATAADTREKLIFTGHPSYAPVSWEKDGVISGASAKMIKLIAQDLGIPVASRSMGSWAAAQEAVRQGTADIIFGIYYNIMRNTTVFLQKRSVPWSRTVRSRRC